MLFLRLVSPEFFVSFVPFVVQFSWICFNRSVKNRTAAFIVPDWFFSRYFRGPRRVPLYAVNPFGRLVEK